MALTDKDGFVDPKIALYQRLIVMRAEGKTWKEIGDALDIHPRRLWDWRHDNAFRLLQDELTDRVKADAKFRIRVLVEKAVDAVDDALSAKQSRDDVQRNVLRLRAAELVLERVGMAKGKPLDAPTGDELPEQELDALAARLGWTKSDGADSTTTPQGNGKEPSRH